MSRQGGSWAIAAAVVESVRRLPPVLGAGAVLAAVLTLVALTLGVLGWRKPLLEVRQLLAPPHRSIALDYSAKVPKSAAYDSTTVAAPEPVFRKLTDDVDVRARYEGAPGTFALTARLTNGTGWHTTMQVIPKKAFAGPVFQATAKLNLGSLVARADAASKAIGTAPSGSVVVALTAQVDSPGLATLSTPVTLEVSPLQMVLGSNSKLRTDSSSATASTTVVPREIGILGLTAAQARSYAILGLIAAGAIAAVIFVISRRNIPLRTRSQIERRYPQLLVHVEPMASPPGKPVVNVDNFPALVKLAERYGQMILTWRRPDADDFVVRDEGITYRYRIPLDEPALQNVEHINRPNVAGTHRRKASSSVS